VPGTTTRSRRNGAAQLGRSHDRAIEAAQREIVACAKAVAALATHRQIRPTLVHYVEHDREIRAVLNAIVRRWTQLVPVTYTTEAAMTAPRTETAKEHVVPCRVLVDRMIMQPRQIRRLLEEGVILARITQREHLQLGGIYVDHRKLYWWMLNSPIEKLPTQGKRRYQKAGIRLHKVS
jgi:hypothetical protein